MNEKTKITELLNQSDSNFDKKNKINRGYGIVPENVVADIESNGITSELLDQFKFPVFKYKTQITLHGKFETGNNYFITGGYKNLIVNKNKSLGVRYSAIDIKKKLLIYNILRLEKSRFSASMNSTSWRSSRPSRSFLSIVMSRPRVFTLGKRGSVRSGSGSVMAAPTSTPPRNT